mgnify:CR=1 FL=1
MISIIIRTKNEERWISLCLKAIFIQDYKDIEVIIVDNKSSDATVLKAKTFNVKVISINEYLPGKAINLGIAYSNGEFICCLSGHCIPVDKSWLTNLVRNFESKEIAGVYGRQEPMSFTSDFDKRDLLNTFGLDKKIQLKDSFFHNANSMIRRDVWEKHPFDENVTNIEDRVWAKLVLEKGYKIIYEPEASVYHYHGIHQNGDKERCFNVVRILESLSKAPDSKRNSFDIQALYTVAIIPIKGDFLRIAGRPLLDYTLKRAFESKAIKDVIIATDNQQVADYAVKAGAKVPFLRPRESGSGFVGLDQVLQYTVLELEKKNIHPEVVVVLKETYPFRSPGLLDELVEEMLNTGVDTIIPVYTEYKSCFRKENEKIKEIDEGFLPREVKEPLYVSQAGLGLVTLTKFIREGRQMGDKIGIFEINDKYSRIEVRDQQDIEMVSPILEKWWY